MRWVTRPMRARKNVTTGSSNVAPKARSMREVNVRYSLTRIWGDIPTEGNSSRKNVKATGKTREEQNAAPGTKRNVAAAEKGRATRRSRSYRPGATNCQAW